MCQPFIVCPSALYIAEHYPSCQTGASEHNTCYMLTLYEISECWDLLHMNVLIEHLPAIRWVNVLVAFIPMPLKYFDSVQLLLLLLLL